MTTLPIPAADGRKPMIEIEIRDLDTGKLDDDPAAASLVAGMPRDWRWRQRMPLGAAVMVRSYRASGSLRRRVLYLPVSSRLGHMTDDDDYDHAALVSRRFRRRECWPRRS
jgi:hypothetical protein